MPRVLIRHVRFEYGIEWAIVSNVFFHKTGARYRLFGNVLRLFGHVLERVLTEKMLMRYIMHALKNAGTYTLALAMLFVRLKNMREQRKQRICLIV